VTNPHPNPTDFAHEIRIQRMRILAGSVHPICQHVAVLGSSENANSVYLLQCVSVCVCVCVCILSTVFTRGYKHQVSGLQTVGRLTSKSACTYFHVWHIVYENGVSLSQLRLSVTL